MLLLLLLLLASCGPPARALELSVRLLQPVAQVGFRLCSASQHREFLFVARPFLALGQVLRKPGVETGGPGGGLGKAQLGAWEVARLEAWI